MVHATSSMTDDTTDTSHEEASNAPNLTASAISVPMMDDNSTTTLSPHAASQSPQPPTSIPSSHSDTPAETITAESQPMMTTSSASSLPAVGSTNIEEPAGPSPYGTRSRNRTGITRPNYAEDREFDMEYEWTSSKKSQASSTTPGVLATITNGKAHAVSTRKSSANGNGTTTSKTGTSGAVASKDYIPGMSTFSVNSDMGIVHQPTSKKRKAPGSHLSSVNAATQRSASAPSRRASQAVLSSGTLRETNLVTFESCHGQLNNGKLKADDGTIYSVNDHVYLICEPPGDPYYIARIMEFMHAEGDLTRPIESLRVNWVYRPKDAYRKASDTRLVYPTMHSDPNPLTSLRGKCRVLHRSDINDLDDYRKTKDSFYYIHLWDRYIQRLYEVIPTSQVTNAPERVKKVLTERWKFVVVEIGRGKELTSAIKSCKRCAEYCASVESVDCAMCKNTYHMNCVRPPLLKKPARGFAWSCGPCSRKQEKKLEARNTPNVTDKLYEEDEEFMDEDEDENGLTCDHSNGTGFMLPEFAPQQANAEQIAITKLWPYRYLGVHCRVEDALDFDDRIYPRASSRLGPRHQANVVIWHGRPLELVKPAEIKRKYMKGSTHKKDAKLSKETIAALEAEKVAREKRPKWVVDEPPGYVRRGEDHPNSNHANTAKALFRMPEIGETSSRGEDPVESENITHSLERREQIIDHYMARAKGLAKNIGVKEYSTNFLDKALQLLYSNKYNAEVALEQLRHVHRRKDLREPDLNKEEQKRFEEGVARYGTNLHEVSKHVGKSQRHADIVRFYYMWKRTPRGRQIWENLEGRQSKKKAKQADSTALVDDVADDCDDSAFDNEKAAMRKRGFECKFCYTRTSPQWRRAPATAPGTTVLAETTSKAGKEKGVHLMVALCQRCAGLWRKYAIQWENIDEVAKKVAAAGGRAWKRKMDEELLIELVNANEASSVGMSSAAAAAAASVGIDVPSSLTILPEQEAARKKQKTGSDKDLTLQALGPVSTDPPKKKVIEKPPEPPLVPEQPKIKALPCAICREMPPEGEEHFCCRNCRLSVHRNCYGIAESRTSGNWKCDMCLNDTNCLRSTTYECVLCPVRHNEYELMEPPKVTHKKKTDREREKERLERELVIEATEQYRRKQYDAGRPFDPREPLKRTNANNWVHVSCAIWIPEIRFGKAETLEPSEGIGLIPQARYEQVCKICKNNTGACVTCHQCPATFHVSCAQQAGYILGFDVTPVKSSRRDVINTVTIGSETGNATAVIYCKEHSVKSIVHSINEPIEGTKINTLQRYVRSYKQADLSLTGTVRKAAIMCSSTKALAHATIQCNGHRASISNGPSGGVFSTTRSSRASPATVTVKSEEVDEDGDRVVHLSDTTIAEPEKQCCSCKATTSPKWHKSKAGFAPRARSPSLLERKPSPPRDNARIGNATIYKRNGGDSTSDPNDSSSNRYLSVLEGGSTQNGRQTGNDFSKSADMEARETAVTVLAQTTKDAPEQLELSDLHITFQCHKCHLKRLKEPSPCLTAPLPTEHALTNPQEAYVTEAHALPAAAFPQVPVAPPPNHYDGWPDQPHPAQSAPLILTNGTPHSPPSHFPQSAQGRYNPAQYYSNGYEQRDRHHSVPVPQVNGSPSSYQMPRNNGGQSEIAQQYSRPAQPHGSPPYARRPSNGMRSPPMVHHRITHAPAGPPRAAENPFLIPHSAHSPPRQPYQASRGSPRPRWPDDRPETPTDGMGRNGAWPAAEGPLTNGASASPSLRNLLH